MPDKTSLDNFQYHWKVEAQPDQNLDPIFDLKAYKINDCNYSFYKYDFIFLSNLHTF